MKTDRLKELEKIAEKLGIGQNREVECVSCHKKIEFKDAILLTNKETVSHLCKECNDKLTKGELTKKQIEEDDILKQIEAIRKDANKQPVPYIPNQDNIPYIPNQDDIPWKRIDQEPYIMPYRGTEITYNGYSNKTDLTESSMLLKLEPEYVNRTS